MKKQIQTPSQERRMKFAEAGILITLVMALAIFVGVRLNGDGQQEITAVQPEQNVVVEDESSARIDSIIQGDAIFQETQPIIDEAEVALTVEEPVATEITPESEPVTYAAAEKAFLAGDHEKAARMFSRYSDQHQDNAWGFYMLGLSEWKAGDPDGAEDAFLRALALKPDHLKSLVNYSRVLMDLGRNADALMQIEMALAVNPNSLDAVRVQGRVQHNLGQLDLATDSYRTVLSGREKDVWALNNLGLVLIEQEKFAEALAPLAKAALLDSSVACIQNNLGIALERTGHFTAAGEAFTRALEAEPGHSRATDSLARVAGLTEATDLVPVDLAAVAAGFTARPELIAPEADMEVASAIESSAPVIDEPETDGSRNR
jgi:Tfp pilus assembly protein PilF